MFRRNTFGSFAVCCCLMLMSCGRTKTTQSRDKGAVDQFAFISIWNTQLGSDSPSPTITLPLTSKGTYDFVVDWGDNTSSIIKTYGDPEKTHRYATHGKYTVTIKGKIVGFSFADEGDRLKITEISQFGSLNLGNDGQYFWGAENLTITAKDPLDLTGTTYLLQAFDGCKSLTTAPSMKQWDVKNVTQMAGMFRNAKKFNEDISDWDVSKATGLQNMFFNAESFNQDIGRWSVSPNAILIRILTGARSFNRSVSKWWIDVTKDNDGVTPATCSSHPSNCTRKDPRSGLWYSKIQGSPTTYSEAFSRCENLVYNGKDDWSLPSQISEVSTATLVNYSRSEMANLGLSETSSMFWNSIAGCGPNHNKRCVEPLGSHFYFGREDFGPRPAEDNETHYVYCVRSDP